MGQSAGIVKGYCTVKVSRVGSQTGYVILETVCPTSCACHAVCGEQQSLLREDS